MIRKYHNHKLQTTPWHCEEEPLNHHETPVKIFSLTVPRRCFFCESFLLSMFRVCHAFLSVHCSLVVTSWERANFLALLYVMVSCVCHFPILCPGSGVVLLIFVILLTLQFLPTLRIYTILTMFTDNIHKN